MKNLATFHSHWIIVSLAVALLALPGCQSALTGNEGNLVFSYTADDEFENFNKPVAVGAKLELRVGDRQRRNAVEITDARSTDESVLIVDSFAANRIILVGAGEGSSLIEVEARLPSGELVTDSVDMLAAVPERLQLYHVCAPDGVSEVRYLTGSTDIALGYELQTEDSRAVIGYGFYPVEFEPADLITLNQSSTNQAFMELDLPGEPAEITISSTIDDEQETISVIEAGLIDGAEMSPLSGDADVVVDSTKLFHFWPTVQDARVCQAQTDLAATSLTPEICEAKLVDADATQLLNQYNSIQVDALAVGTCEFEVTFTAGNGGEGASTTFTREIVEPAQPSEPAEPDEGE